MSSQDNNPAAGISVSGPSISHKVFRGGPTRTYRSSVLADDGLYNIALVADDSDAGGLYYAYDLADPTDGALFTLKATGATVNTVRIASDFGGSIGWDDADTDTKYCLYTTGGLALLKNRSGNADVTLCISRLN